MLSKRVCSNCWNMYASKFPPLEWNIQDEQRWEQFGVVSCNHDGLEDININEEPPDDCPYKFEQAIADGCS